MCKGKKNYQELFQMVLESLEFIKNVSKYLNLIKVTEKGTNKMEKNSNFS